MRRVAPRVRSFVKQAMENQILQAAAGSILSFDKKVRAAVLPYRNSRAVKITGWMSDVGDQPALRMLTGAVVVTGLVRGDLRMIRAGVRMLLAHELATVAKGFVKERVDRTRPRSASSSADQEPEAGRSQEKEETSFPSGHSAGSMAVARAFARAYPTYRTLASGAAACVALAQIPRCAHYPSDVVAGAGLGAAAETFVEMAGRLLRLPFVQTSLGSSGERSMERSRDRAADRFSSNS